MNSIIEFVGEFAREEDILNWIVEQGGWEAIGQLTREATPTAASVTTDSSGYNRLTNTVLAFVLCSIGAVFAVFAAGNLIDNV